VTLTRPRASTAPRAAEFQRGFTLTELAVVLAIVGFLLGSLMYTLSAQTEQRNFEETRRRLDAARELVLAYAIVRGRLPCPATATSSADEALTGGNCDTNFGGWLPARTIGFQQVDQAGYAIDAWGSRIRYAVANAVDISVATCATPALPHFVNATNLKGNGITCSPNNLVVCKSATGITATTCGTATNALTNQTTVVALVFSVGKNAATVGSGGIDEAANIDGTNGTFVFHTPAPAGASNGEFDDYLVWITVGELYGRLIAAGVLQLRRSTPRHRGSTPA
jgi:prepilin-type N-terminal cleavage/methylation domain-containing protein